MENKKTTYIKFLSPVVPESINALMQIIDQKLKEGTKHFVLLISTPGGNVFYGLSAYNYLKGIPAQVTTHNFGSVDSVGVVLYCAGERRLSVPHARFLLHGVQFNVNQPMSFEEDQLDEKMKGLKIDIRNISKVIADTVGKEIEEVVNSMRERATLNPEEAKGYGLVQEIDSKLFPEGAEIISIMSGPQQPRPQPQPQPQPRPQPQPQPRF